MDVLFGLLGIRCRFCFAIMVFAQYLVVQMMVPSAGRNEAVDSPIDLAEQTMMTV
jgi:hypothetical protein